MLCKSPSDPQVIYSIIILPLVVSDNNKLNLSFLIGLGGQKGLLVG